MNSEAEQNQETPTAAAPEAAPATAATDEAAAPEPAQPDLMTLMEQQLNLLKGELAQAKDQYIRSLAELENFKRRKNEETKDRLKYSTQGLAKAVIIGLDNLELALNQAQPGEHEQFASFIKGIEMVKVHLLDSLSKNDIQRFDPKGEKFDPNRHEALGMIETSEVPDGHVAGVMQAGYLLHDRVIRPARVQVGKKPAEQTN